MEKSNQLIKHGPVGPCGKRKAVSNGNACCFSIWSGSLRWLLLFTQTRVQTLHLRRSNITWLLQKATVSYSFFEGRGPYRDKRIQSVTLGHFFFTPATAVTTDVLKLFGSRISQVFSWLHMWKISQNADNVLDE